MDESRVIGVRDPNGFRPLCLGKLEDGGWVLASESPALDIVGAHFVRELLPGEMVVIDADRPAVVIAVPRRARRPQALPLRVRLLRPARHPPLQPERPPGPHPHRRAARRAGAGRGRHGDGRARVGGARRRGLRPPQRHPVRPGRGQEPLHRPQLHRPEPGAPRPGRAHEAQPAPRERRRASGSSWSTTPSCGAPPRSSSPRCCARPARREVHLRITSPPVKWSCFYGIDTGDRTELLASSLAIDEIREYLNVDSLAYVSLDRLKTATGAPGAGFCDACFTGDYPVAVPVTLAQARPRGAGRARRRARPSRRRSTEASVRGHELRGRGGQHLGRRGGRRADQVEGALDLPPRGHRRHRRVRRAVRVRPAPLHPPRARSAPPTASAPRRSSPRPPVASTRSASTWWRCASTTSSARAPSRCSSSTTSRWASSTPTTSSSSSRGWRSGAGRPAARSSAARWPSTPARWTRASSTSSASRSAWSSAIGSSPASTCSAATCSSGSPLPVCAPTATRSPARCCSRARAATSQDPAWPGAHHSLADELLVPSVVYAPAIAALLRQVDVRAIAHITGGGLPGNLVAGAPRGEPTRSSTRGRGRRPASSARSSASAR